jgi:transposase
MMGIKARAFGPLPPVTLEDLVPPDHFSRCLERALDLGFVRDLGCEAYADSGRPAIDPAVCFTLPPILFFKGLRSERQPMRVVADRAAPLPYHASLTHIRACYGLAVLRRFFETIVERCIGAGGRIPGSVRVRTVRLRSPLHKVLPIKPEMVP